MGRETFDKGFSGIGETPSYRLLVRSRKRLVIPSVIFLLALLLVLAVLTSFTSVLDGQIVPGLNWALVYAYVVFFAPVVFCHLYSWRSNHFDSLGEAAVLETEEREGERP